MLKNGVCSAICDKVWREVLRNRGEPLEIKGRTEGSFSWKVILLNYLKLKNYRMILNFFLN